MMWRYAIPVVMLAVLGGFFLRGLDLNPQIIESALIGKQAPQFSLPNLEHPSETIHTADLSGRYSLLNVWATWCVECRREHGFLLELEESGMPIYGLNWKDERDAALEWLAVLGDPYVASAVDATGDVGIDYGVYGAPETFLIGPDGTILEKYLGPMNRQVWESTFAPLIEADRGND
jgi:cytochrome c biogenesis protein CcmG/thiol:disulfide interchange protein DsbE